MAVGVVLVVVAFFGVWMLLRTSTKDLGVITNYRVKAARYWRHYAKKYPTDIKGYVRKGGNMDSNSMMGPYMVLGDFVRNLGPGDVGEIHVPRMIIKFKVAGGNGNGNGKSTGGYRRRRSRMCHR